MPHLFVGVCDIIGVRGHGVLLTDKLTAEAAQRRPTVELCDLHLATRSALRATQILMENTGPPVGSHGECDTSSSHIISFLHCASH